MSFMLTLSYISPHNHDDALLYAMSASILLDAVEELRSG